MVAMLWQAAPWLAVHGVQLWVLTWRVQVLHLSVLLLLLLLQQRLRLV
jgi:hypothetical protein